MRLPNDFLLLDNGDDKSSSSNLSIVTIISSSASSASSLREFVTALSFRYGFFEESVNPVPKCDGGCWSERDIIH